MKAKDLRERSLEDLRELEKSLAKDAFQARFKNFTNRLDDTSSISKARRDLARVKTILRQLELNAAVKESAAAAPKVAAKSAAPKVEKAGASKSKKTQEEAV